MTIDDKNIITTKLYHHVLEGIFGGFIRLEAPLLQSIKALDGDIFIDKAALIFTLPALFEFSCKSFENVSGHKINNTKKSYLCFRKALYTNPTNHLLQQQGAYVEIQASHSDINKSQYKLVLITIPE